MLCPSLRVREPLFSSVWRFSASVTSYSAYFNLFETTLLRPANINILRRASSACLWHVSSVYYEKSVLCVVFYELRRTCPWMQKQKIQIWATGFLNSLPVSLTLAGQGVGFSFLGIFPSLFSSSSLPFHKSNSNDCILTLLFSSGQLGFMCSGIVDPCALVTVVTLEAYVAHCCSVAADQWAAGRGILSMLSLEKLLVHSFSVTTNNVRYGWSWCS